LIFNKGRVMTMPQGVSKGTGDLLDDERAAVG
jgi:hypothetical protein